ncbi:DUF3027 domain-containing protein [Corynebacterium alimapuense]|uniref:DUF3027 domain-containing protein n=1 Tax=Corynebacterium alimapuense TaxID=1576874 RepID=A0A3M8K646_9CORY|nr:DUF3027 domain-containing protein [Corynebacterium alimapuense]RNE48646.1 DUF3027 domain-containing protein [Corynebacterium alimapuense]
MTHNGIVSTSNRRRKISRPPQESSPLLDSRAISLARATVEELGEGGVGEHLGVQGLGGNVATHRFAADVPGYSGWEWNVVLACASGSRRVTVNELALMPAPSGEALRAPEWVPWSDRLRPGDLGPGDLMPPALDDERLDRSGDGELTLSRRGLDAALQRWRTGDYGPTSEFAEKANLSCRSCAFFVSVGKTLGSNFGACVNEYSADGHIVHATYGCGAHSGTPDDDLADETPDAYDDERPIF